LPGAQCQIANFVVVTSRRSMQSGHERI